MSPLQYSAHQPFSAPQKRLEYLIVEINGSRRLVSDRQQIEIVRGDTIKVIDAVLADPTLRVQYINVVGFRNPPDNGRDRGYHIDTDRDLLPGFSLHGRGQRYSISIGSGKKIHGEVFLSLLAPVLRFAVLQVNASKSLVLRDGETVQVGVNDKLKIAKVSTNFSTTTDLTFNIYRPRFAADKKYEIRFERRKKIFARIPLLIIDE